jgi:hypothetical protein
MNGYTTVTKPSNDFRDWDIEPETSAGSVDANDHPSYVWRGPADCRLTLAWTRYGVQQKVAKVDRPGVSEDRDYLALLAVLPRCLRSVRND